MRLVVLLVAAAMLGASPAVAAEPSDEEAAEALLLRWMSGGAAACEARAAACAGMDATLARAAAAFQAAHRRSRAIEVRRLLANPTFHLDATPAGTAALLELGRDYEAIGDYEDAAGWLERFARSSPQREEAPVSLEDAARLRLGLGQAAEARADAELFARNYGSKRAARTWLLELALAQDLLEREDFAAAKKELERRVPALDRTGPIDTRLIAHAWLGRSAARIGDAKKASSEYRAARELGSDPSALTRAAAAEGDDPRRLGRALIALGEARFFFAEPKRLEAEAIRMPAYHGPGDQKGVAIFVGTEVARWMSAKRPAIEAAEKAYLEILQIQPAPPPEWVIAAASRVGDLWADFVRDFRATPIPREWAGSEHAALRAAYYQAIDDAAEAPKQRARAAYRKCLEYSVKFQVRSAYVESCELWLSRHYRLEFPRITELAPAGGRSASPMPPGAPLPDPRKP